MCNSAKHITVHQKSIKVHYMQVLQLNTSSLASHQIQSNDSKCHIHAAYTC